MIIKNEYFDFCCFFFKRFNNVDITDKHIYLLYIVWEIKNESFEVVLLIDDRPN